MEGADREDDEDIDRKIGEMANDPEVIAEGARITAEFEQADWDAFQLGENAEPGSSPPPDPIRPPRR